MGTITKKVMSLNCSKVWQIALIFSVLSGAHFWQRLELTKQELRALYGNFDENGFFTQDKAGARIGCCSADKDKPWSYDDSLPNGPSNWGKTYPNCKSPKQTPINIDTSKVKYGNGRQRLNLTNYHIPVTSAKIENLGYRVKVSPTDEVPRSVFFNGSYYYMTHLHMHWGNTSTLGSEHEINGNKYSLETHIMHVNDAGDVIAVGYFLQQSNQNNPAIGSLSFLTPFIEYEGDVYEGPLPQPLSLDDLVVKGCNFYRYEGAEAFPPCTPGVTWLVCRSNGVISSTQLRQLFSLYRVKKGSEMIEECHIVNNYRTVQPLNGRTIYG